MKKDSRKRDLGWNHRAAMIQARKKLIWYVDEDAYYG